MVKRMERNIDRMEGFREVLDSDDGWTGAESHAKRVEALDFLEASLGADHLYMRAQIELHSWLGGYYYGEDDLDRSREEYTESLRLIERDPYMAKIYKDEVDKIREDLDDLDSGYEEDDDEIPGEEEDYETPDEEDAEEVQPMTRSRSEISPEDAKIALKKMEIDGLYTCEYHAGEGGTLNFTSKSDTVEGRALASLLNEAAKRLAINILALPGPMKTELMEMAGALNAHRSTAPPAIGVARNCPFTSVRRSSDGLVLFDAEIVELFIKMMNDPNYSNYKIHYDHVIDWLISERLFHEIFHASREKEQTIRDIHYYYLLLNTAGMRKDVEEFFDSPLVKDSRIAQKSKVRFKFLERQARRLMRTKPIDIKKVSRFLGPYKKPIELETDVFEKGPDLKVYRGRDLVDEDELVRGFLEGLFSNALHKKTVLAFSDSLGKQNGRALRILDTVKELKRDKVLGHLFKNVEVIICPAQNMHNKLQGYFGDSHAQVFTFVNAKEEALVNGLKNKNPVSVFYIDDAQLENESMGSSDKVYYPILEVVT
ncbi:MAG TPA: hypothetical protein PLV52_06170, partial [Candidatus Omnitrophota bacterium]|nr:hypothetical protein [Candidatus Omnitrophota bacterium]